MGQTVAVIGHHNTAGSVISFSMSHKNDNFDLESVSAYAGHVKFYGANDDPVIQTTYLLSRKDRATEVGFEQLYSAESSPRIACPRK